jgi:hypothetical protein
MSIIGALLVAHLVAEADVTLRPATAQIGFVPDLVHRKKGLKSASVPQLHHPAGIITFTALSTSASAAAATSARCSCVAGLRTGNVSPLLEATCSSKWVHNGHWGHRESTWLARFLPLLRSTTDRRQAGSVNTLSERSTAAEDAGAQRKPTFSFT